MKKKICVVTGSRAEYGLLCLLMKEIQKDSELELQIVATNMHLSPEFGLTYNQIEKDGFVINKKIEMLLSSDTEVGVAKSIGVAMLGFAEAFDDLKPHMLVVLGDRFEILTAVYAALIHKIPVAHIAGGEKTEGAFDEAIRHSITKMSHLHFTATEEYRKRVIQLGENPNRVYNVGAIAIDNVKKIRLLSKEQFEAAAGFKLAPKNLLVTFHPVTLEKHSSESQFSEILAALDTLEETHLFFTKPNSDTSGRVIIKMIDDYVAQNRHKAVSFVSMGQLRYLSALQFMDAVVGNSSSGIVEAPSFKIGTINIGERQRGRIRAQSVIDCDPTKESLLKSLKELYSSEFKNLLYSTVSPFGEGDTTVKVFQTIKETLRRNSLSDMLKKTFFDMA